MTDLQTIDFSALTPQSQRKPPSSPWNSLFWAIGITLALAAVIGLGALISINGNRDTIMPAIGLGCMVLFIAALLITGRVAFRGMAVQKEMMGQFAEANGWHFDAKRRFAVSAELPQFAQRHIGRGFRRFSMTGSANGYEFAYYQLYITLAPGFIADRPWIHSSHVSIISQISLESFHMRQLDEQTYECADNGYRFTIYLGNVLTREAMHGLLAVDGLIEEKGK